MSPNNSIPVLTASLLFILLSFSVSAGGGGNTKDIPNPSDAAQDQTVFKVIEHEGTYQGQNLMINNPFMFKEQHYCIKEVILNDKTIMTDPTSAKFGISLSSFGEGEYVKLTIKHHDKCYPKLLNAKALLSDTKFELVSIKVDEEALKWTTNNEKNQQPFIVEQQIFNKWVPVATFVANGTEGFNNYSYHVNHHSGLNKYRIKRRDIVNNYHYSEIVQIESQIEKVTFYPTRVDNSIYLSKAVPYRVFSENGAIVLQGEATEEIDVSSLNSGIYYLQIDNATEKFFKK